MATAANQEELEGNEAMAVVAVGQSRSGKSMALNNLFGTDFPSQYSTSSVTKEVATRRVVKEGQSIIVVDTPGLGSRDLTLSKVRKELEKAIGGLDFLLLYCYSVSPNNPKTPLDIQVMKNLKKTLGNDIWKKCVLLLTGCDLLRKSACPKLDDREKYKDYLKDHTIELTKMLRESWGQSIPEVKTVFEVDVNNLQNEPKETIFAAPVGVKRERINHERHRLTPEWEDNWVNIAFKVIQHKAVPLKCKEDEHITEGKISAGGSIAGIGIGAAVGAVVAGTVGSAAAGIGAIPAALIGTIGGSVVGGVVGGASGISMQKVKNVLHHKELKEKEEKLKNADTVPIPPDTTATETTAEVSAERPDSTPEPPSPSDLSESPTEARRESCSGRDSAFHRSTVAEVPPETTSSSSDNT